MVTQPPGLRDPNRLRYAPSLSFFFLRESPRFGIRITEPHYSAPNRDGAALIQPIQSPTLSSLFLCSGIWIFWVLRRKGLVCCENVGAMAKDNESIFYFGFLCR